MSSRTFSAPTARDAVIIAALRTPFATRGAQLRTVGVDALAAPLLRELHRQTAGLGVGSGAGHAAPDDVLLGNCMGPGGNLARIAALRAGLGVEVPGMTVDRQCGSGLAAILTAASALSSGHADYVLAGGAESASTAPLRILHDRPYDRAPFTPDGFPDPEMGPAAEELARRYGFRRAQVDAIALYSHRRALDRGAALRSAEILPLAVDHPEAILGEDPGPRDIATLLPRFPALHGGVVTAGNSSRNSDGAAAVSLVTEAFRARAAGRGIPGLRIVDSVSIGCDPALPGLGPVAAIHALCARTGISLDEVAAIELVEAFAAQHLAVLRALGLVEFAEGTGLPRPDPRVNSAGGTLALGHPWGASGAHLLVRLFSRLVRSGEPAGTLGLAAVAVGGGMGIVALVEVIR